MIIGSSDCRRRTDQDIAQTIMEPSPILEQILIAAGWYRGRKTNRWRIWSIRRTLARHGFVVHQAAEGFFREFGGLILKFTHSKAPSFKYELEITANWPETPLLPGIAAVDSRVGPLTPIALIADSPYLDYFMMAPDGRTFRFIDGLFGDPRVDNVVWGPQPSGIEALEATVAFQEWPIYAGGAT